MLIPVFASGVLSRSVGYLGWSLLTTSLLWFAPLSPLIGRHVLITVAVHGDEPCGMHGFNNLLDRGFFEKLPPSTRITAMVGNPAAVVQGKRFLQHNLNRLIHPGKLDMSTYESERARVICRAISKCHEILDLHSCSAKYVFLWFSPVGCCAGSSLKGGFFVCLVVSGYLSVHSTACGLWLLWLLWCVCLLCFTALPFDVQFAGACLTSGRLQK
jgi:Succinylglutamate desuccinylase / Aspartoacylase family